VNWWLLVSAAAVIGCGSGERPPTAAPLGTPAVVDHNPTPSGTETQPRPAASPRAKRDAIEMTFAGDVMFGRFKPGGFRPIRAERLDPFTQVAPLLASDFAMVNLETPVMRKPPAKSSYGTDKRFVAPPERVATLARHGVTAVTIANNHFWDMHRAGAVETPEVLRELGFTVIGAARHEAPIFRVETVTVNGWKLGFIAGATECNTNWDRATPKLPWTERKDIGAALAPVVTAARTDHDLVIVTMHWGKEYLDAPEPWQVRAAHRWIDAGADAVIGHHPHVLQGIENYKGKPIAYSLGNFLFDNTSSNRKWGGVLRLRFEPRGDGGCTSAATFWPTITVPTPGHHVTVARGKGFKAIATRLTKVSRAKVMKRTEWTVDADHLTSPFGCE
jgi:poly-gamma-glutamate synthesis protein (capsule biosynthesis protein)